MKPDRHAHQIKTTPSLDCKNCEQVLKGHYCCNCGQAANTHTINFHFLWHDIQHSLLHFDKGIFFTLKQLFTRPGHSIREFLEGKRVRHLKPVSFVIIMATIYGLISHSLHLNEDLIRNVAITKTDATNTAVKINDWVATHYAWVSLLWLPFYSWGSFLAFKKQGYNFTEYMVLNAYLAGQKLAVRLLLIPLIYFTKGTNGVALVTTIITIVDFVLNYWVYAQFFNKVSRIKAFFLTVLSYLIPLLTFIIIAVVAVAIHGALSK